MPREPTSLIWSVYEVRARASRAAQSCQSCTFTRTCRQLVIMAAITDTRASLEVTKGASLVDPIPVAGTPSLKSINEGDESDTLLMGPFPTEEEWATLPRVAGSIPWTAWTVAFVEFVERFSYYGTSAVFVNFIQKKLPPGSKTGAGFLKKPGSGALGMGQRASTGMTTCKCTTAHLGAFDLTVLQSTSSGPTSPPSSVPTPPINIGDVTSPFSMRTSSQSSATSSLSALPFLKSSSNRTPLWASLPLVSLLWVLEPVASSPIFHPLSRSSTRTSRPMFASTRTERRRL